MIPERRQSAVFFPIAAAGGVSGTRKSRAARRKSDSAEASSPGANAPPRKSPSAETTSKFVVVPKSTTIAGPPYRRWARSVVTLIVRFGRPGAHALLPHLRLEPLRHIRGHELLDGCAEGGELLHARRGYEEVLGGRHQVHHLDPRGERPVHVRHLELELEVRERADPAHDEASRRGVREVDLQAVEARDLDVAVLRAGLTHQLDALVGGEDRLLREVAT